MTLLLSILRVLGWIVGGLLAFVLGLMLLIGLILCIVKLSVRVEYCQKPFVAVQVGWFRFVLVGGPKRADRPPRQKRKPKPKQEPRPAPDKPKKPPRTLPAEAKPPLTEVLAAFRDLIVGMCRGFAREIEIELLRLRVLVATDDPAKTGMLYGTVCALLTSVQAIAEHAPRIRKDHVTIAAECDFLACSWELDAAVCLSVRGWRLLRLSLRSARPVYQAIRLLRDFTAKTEQPGEPDERKSGQ